MSILMLENMLRTIREEMFLKCGISLTREVHTYNRNAGLCKTS